jgi:hypothetical protein
MSRSAVIRAAIEIHLAAHEHGAVGEAIADGYRRIPPGTPDEWGDLVIPVLDQVIAAPCTRSAGRSTPPSTVEAARRWRPGRPGRYRGSPARRATVP